MLLVVAIRLGCLNHALLTAESIQRRGLSLLGWVANQVSPDTPRARENIDALKARIPAPILATVAYSPKPAVAHFQRGFQADGIRRFLKPIAKG